MPLAMDLRWSGAASAPAGHEAQRFLVGSLGGTWRGCSLETPKVHDLMRAIRLRERES